jgi:hypothetical protein
MLVAWSEYISPHVRTSKKYFSYGAVNNMSRVEHTNTQKGQERIPTHTTLSQFQKIKLRVAMGTGKGRACECELGNHEN